MGVRVLGFASTLVLARLLTPTDFGLVAMAVVVTAGLELLTLFNLDMALVQVKQLERRHLDSAWTVNLALGSALALAITVLTIPVAAFYREPRLEWLMPVLALKYLIESAANPGVVEFRRALAFRPEFHLQIWPKFAGIAVALPLAWWWRDYRALLAGLLVNATVACLLSYALHPYRPSWCLSEARGLFHFSRWLLLNNMMSFLRTRGADLIVGRMLGPASLGIFTVAWELSHLPSTEFLGPVNRVLFPSYVQLAHDPERLRDGFRVTLGWVTLIILPLCAGVAALAYPFVRVLLGEKWLEAVPLVAVLAIAGAALVPQATTGSVYNALGKPSLVALTGALHACILIPLLLAATPRYGLLGAATATLAYSVVGCIVTYCIFLRKTPIRLGDLVRVCWRPLIGCIALYAGVRLFVTGRTHAEGFVDNAVTLLAGSLIGAAIYVAVVLLLWLLAARPESAEQTLLRYASRARIARKTLIRAATGSEPVPEPKTNALHPGQHTP
jgi:PST family polysaccharide transporter